MRIRFLVTVAVLSSAMMGTTMPAGASNTGWVIALRTDGLGSGNSDGTTLCVDGSVLSADWQTWHEVGPVPVTAGVHTFVSFTKGSYLDCVDAVAHDPKTQSFKVTAGIVLELYNELAPTGAYVAGLRTVSMDPCSNGTRSKLVPVLDQHDPGIIYTVTVDSVAIAGPTPLSAGHHEVGLSRPFPGGTMRFGPYPFDAPSGSSVAFFYGGEALFSTVACSALSITTTMTTTTTSTPTSTPTPTPARAPILTVNSVIAGGRAASPLAAQPAAVAVVATPTFTG